MTPNKQPTANHYKSDKIRQNRRQEKMATRAKKSDKVAENATEPAQVVINAPEPVKVPDKRWLTLTVELTTEEVMESLLRDRPELFNGFDCMEMFLSLTGGSSQVVKMRKPMITKTQAPAWIDALMVDAVGR